MGGPGVSTTQERPQGHMRADRAPSDAPSSRRRGRPRLHGHDAMRRTLSALTTKRLDGRSAVAVAVRTFKADIRRDLGNDLTRAQETILEDAAQAWVIRQALDDWMMRQPSLVTRKRTLLPVVEQRMRVAEHLARQLDRLGLERRAKPVPSLSEYLGAGRPAPAEGREVAMAETNPQNPQNPHEAAPVSPPTPAVSPPHGETDTAREVR
jgi:hypothetical protein